MKTRTLLLALLTSMLAGVLPLAIQPARGELRIRDICRVKGQEENTLQGLGLVVGLKGTGDGDTPTLRALARTMQLMGTPLGQGGNGQMALEELKNARNVALVFVTATIPAEGARQGGTLNCSINAISAKSLEGGYLMMTPLLGPRPGNPRIYGFAQGPVYLEDTAPPTTAKIHQGCRLEENFDNVFIQDGTINLVVDRNHASFQMAQDIEDTINNQPDFLSGRNNYEQAIAQAKDQVNIEVRIPPKYTSTPVLFVSQVLDQRILYPQNSSRVVINERDGVVIIGADVGIGPVAVTHKNLTIEAGGAAVNQFLPLDPGSDTSTTKLKALVDALNALKVPTKDIIDIIKGLERSGDLFGRLIIE